MSLVYRTPEIEQKFLADWNSSRFLIANVDWNGVVSPPYIGDIVMYDIYSKTSLPIHYRVKKALEKSKVKSAWHFDFLDGEKAEEFKALDTDLSKSVKELMLKMRLIKNGKELYEGFVDQMIGLRVEAANELKYKPESVIDDPGVMNIILNAALVASWQAIWGSQDDPKIPGSMGHLRERPNTILGTVSGGTEKRIIDAFASRYVKPDYVMAPTLQAKDGRFTGNYEFRFEWLGRKKFAVHDMIMPMGSPETVDRDRLEPLPLRWVAQKVATKIWKKTKSSPSVLIIDDQEGEEKKRELLELDQRYRERWEHWKPRQQKRKPPKLFENVFDMAVDPERKLRDNKSVDIYIDRFSDILALPRRVDEAALGMLPERSVAGQYTKDREQQPA